MKIKCPCGKEFTNGLKLAQHRKKCAEFQKAKYYTSASVKQIQELLRSDGTKK